MTTPAAVPRTRRANGEASRRKILEAAAEIAGERGYEGTSISLVSERSGLPVSSIYWHFRDKDDLIAAVIDDSFERWSAALYAAAAPLHGATAADAFRSGLRGTGRALEEFSDFLRLGLMLVLERRPDELTARARFVETRWITKERTARLFASNFVDLDSAAIDQLAVLAMALADGLFIANQVEHVPLDQAFDLMATTIEATAARLQVRQ